MRLLLQEDTASKWIKNTLLFIRPLALLYLAFVIVQVKDGVQAADFLPSEETVGAMTLYVLNVLYDYFRKLE